MKKCMIFKDATNTDEENRVYEQTISEIARNIASGHTKGKNVLLITGSGISPNVYGMEDIMNKIKDLINIYDDSWKRSSVFQKIYDDYCKADDHEKHQMQARLLTYIQNAYMNKSEYVQFEDLGPLSNIWSDFVIWLLNSEGMEPEKEKKGVLNAGCSENHRIITKLYEDMRAISITTNFDNLLQKSFEENDLNFYPIIDIEAFDKYYLSNTDDKSFIEIQSRGDVFWMECTGKKNKICLNMHRQCLVPSADFKPKEGKILCNICKSEAKIYFAFPGTKEKDAEMSVIINGVWKYLANSISHVIVIGNSMDYDPVLIEFLRELIRKRKVPVLYISRYKEDEEGNGIKDVSEIYKKEATKFLFADYEDTQNVWARAKETEEILKDLLEGFQQQKKLNIVEKYSENEKLNVEEYFKLKIDNLFTNKYGDLETELRRDGDIPQIFDITEIKQMRQFSQLGLKTYWLNKDGERYQEHNRLKHSVGVMLIASYLYLKINEKPDKNELKFLQLAALLHDLGHLPFSHLLEEVFDEFGWIPAGESATFNHEYYTKRLIEKLMEDNEEDDKSGKDKKGNKLKEIMEKIGYSVTELQQLINGEYGKGYLDALINSPLDCDKIEYLFSDSTFMHRGSKQDFDTFIQDYAADLSANQNNFLVIQGNSTKSFLKLIRMRGEMYDQVYLRSGLRYLEACCKLIIRTFIVYECAEESVFSAIEDKSEFVEYFNLSDSKIKKVIDFMAGCLEDIRGDQVCEIHVLQKMVKELERNPVISDIMKETVRKCIDLIDNSKREVSVADIETQRILTYEVSAHRFDKETLKQLSKNVYLRFPGVVLLDYVESKSSFSFGKRETRRRRSDGTRSATENILIKDIPQIKGRVDKEFKCLGDAVEDVNKELHYSNYSYINIYRISDNLFSYMQAEDYILNELRKEGIINEQ